MEAKFKDVTTKIAETFNCKAEVLIKLRGDATVNDEETAQFVLKTARELVGEDQVSEADASTGAEDFAYFGQKFPAAFVFLGIKNEVIGSTAALHNPNFKVDENVLHIGAALHTSLALEYLSKHHSNHEQKTEL